jgi:hypothetical protein
MQGQKAGTHISPKRMATSDGESSSASAAQHRHGTRVGHGHADGSEHGGHVLGIMRTCWPQMESSMSSGVGKLPRSSPLLGRQPPAAPASNTQRSRRVTHARTSSSHAAFCRHCHKSRPAKTVRNRGHQPARRGQQLPPPTPQPRVTSPPPTRHERCDRGG